MHIEEKYRAKIALHGPPLQYQDNGYKNTKIIKKAIKLLGIPLLYVDKKEVEWIKFFRKYVWAVFDLEELFDHM